MTKQPDLDLEADEIVTAAVEIFQESGLDAVSMRSVAARLGVSPMPLYSRVGNKDALLDFWYHGDTWTQPEVNDFIQKLQRV